VDATKLKQEVAQQEVLLQGYQKENEKMAGRIKELESRIKHPAGPSQPPDHAASASSSGGAEARETTGVESSLSQAKREWDERELQDFTEAKRVWSGREMELKFEVDKLKGAKRELETRLAHAEGLNAEGEARAKQLAVEEVAKVKEASASAQGEMQRRLEWYQENQELITKNETALKDQTKLIDMLKRKLVVAAESMVVSQTGDKGKQLKLQRAADAKRIGELEKQLRELEVVIDKRNPNSIAAMVRATKPSQDKIREAEKLRDQLARTEAERDLLEEDHEKGIRAIRQQYERGTAATNRRIATLEEQLKAAQTRHTAKGSAARVRELEKQLADVRMYYKKKNAELTERVEAIAASPLPEESGKPVAVEAGAGETELREALAKKDDEIEALQRDTEALRLAVVQARIQTPPQVTRDSAPAPAHPVATGSPESIDDRMFTDHRVRQAEMLLRMREEEMATLRCEAARREGGFHEEVSKVRQEGDRRRKELAEDHDRSRNLWLWSNYKERRVSSAAFSFIYIVIT